MLCYVMSFFINSGITSNLVDQLSHECVNNITADG